MRGDDALWQPGTDHAGIATQMVVERQLAAGGQRPAASSAARRSSTGSGSGRRESGGTITRQLRRLGASPDWPRERFTMDEGLSQAVRKVFVTLHKQGLIYRDKRLVNWDPKLQTAISDLEVQNAGGEGPSLALPLSDRRRAGPVHHRRDDPAGDHAGRHRRRRASGGRALPAT